MIGECKRWNVGERRIERRRDGPANDVTADDTEFLVVIPPGCPLDGGAALWPVLLEGDLFEAPRFPHGGPATPEGCAALVAAELRSHPERVLIEWRDAQGHGAVVRLGLRSTSTVSITGTTRADHFAGLIDRIDALVAVCNPAFAVASCGRSFRSRYHLRDQAALASIGQSGVVAPRRLGLMGIAPVTWFGQPWIDAFGGDDVFMSLPANWTARTRHGWKVYGVADPLDPADFEPHRWSDRERALIEAFGPQHFFNVETGQLAAVAPELVGRRTYPIYIRDDSTGTLTVARADTDQPGV